MDPMTETTGLDLLLWARLHAAGLPIPDDRARLGRELARHLRQQELLRAATAGFGTDDGPLWPGHPVVAGAIARPDAAAGDERDG